MPSPLPGMDPYLQAPHIWPDFHHALAAEMRSELNQCLPDPYYARLEMRPELGIISVDPIRHHFVEIRDSSQGHKLITFQARTAGGHSITRARLRSRHLPKKTPHGPRS